MVSSTSWSFEGLDSEELSERMQSILFNHSEKLRAWAHDPVLVAALKEQNAKPTSMEEIKKIDEAWIAGTQTEFAKSLQLNAVGKYLQNKISESAIYVEAFLCDKQGAVVGEYPGSTDYWQGDEDKFIKSFNGGSGKLFIGPIALDKSTDTISVQMSVPVKEANETIGVLVVGLRNIK
jgi:hypothetical protein